MDMGKAGILEQYLLYNCGLPGHPSAAFPRTTSHNTLCSLCLNKIKLKKKANKFIYAFWLTVRKQNF